MPLLFTVILLDLIGFGIVIPILPFLSPQLGASKLDIALIIATYAACAGLCGGFWGRLSDRIGRRKVIVICLCGAALSYLFLALASVLWMVFAARAFAGLMAGNFGVASAMMADLTGPENRARGMGLIGAAWGLGIMLGPFLGGMLSGDSGSFVLPCLVAGGMSLLAALAAVVFLPETVSARARRENRIAQREGGQGSAWQMLKEGGHRLLVLQYLLHNSAASGFTYLVPLWLGDVLGWTAREVGLVFGTQGAFMVILQAGVLAPMVRILGEWPFLRIMVAIFFCGLGLAVVAEGVTWMLAAVFITLCGGTLCIPLLNTITSHRAALSQRGRMLGTTSAASSWGRVCGPLLAGSCLAIAGYSVAFAACAVVVLGYFCWTLWEGPRERAMV